MLKRKIEKMDDEQLDRVIRKGVAAHVKKLIRRGCPVAMYDAEKKAPYIQYPDGRREYEKKL